MNDADTREFLALSEKDIFEEARDRLKIAADSDGDNRLKAEYDLLFREGEQWDQQPVTSQSQETPELVINLTDAMCERVVNNIRQQRPRGKCHPVGDGAQIEIAEIINGIGRHIEYRSDAGVAYDNGGDTAVTMGWGYWRLIPEYIAPDSFDMELRIAPIFNAFSVYVDPDAQMPTACDMNWCIITTKMKRTEYKRRYPRADNASWSDLQQEKKNAQWESKESIRLAEYFRIREVPQKLYLLTDANGQEMTRYADEMPAPESLQAAGYQIIGERQSVRRRVEWFRLNGTKVVERQILFGTWIPVFRCQGKARNIDGDIKRRGMVRAMIDPQRMVNYGEVAKIKRLGLAPQAPWIAAEGQLDGHPEWHNTNREPITVLEYKPVTVTTAQGDVVLPPPQRQPPAQIEAGFSEFVQGMRNNLMAVAGMPNEPGVDKEGEVISGRAIQRRQFLSDQSHYQYYDNLTLAIAHTWRVMLEWIPHYYSRERMQRIIGEDGTPKTVTINQRTSEDGVSKVKNDLSVGRYDVVMDTGPGYETKREEGADAMIGLMKTPLGEIVAKSGADLIFRSLDHPYMQELADRLASASPQGLKAVMEGLPDRAKAIVQQLAGQNQQLQQALQQLQLELKYKMGAEQLKVQAKEQDTQAWIAHEDRKTAVDAHTRLAVEEIKAGASLMNTHVEAIHHRKEAEAMAKHAVQEEDHG